MNKYSKKQILEAIGYWTNVLRQIDEQINQLDTVNQNEIRNYLRTYCHLSSNCIDSLSKFYSILRDNKYHCKRPTRYDIVTFGANPNKKVWDIVDLEKVLLEFATPDVRRQYNDGIVRKAEEDAPLPWEPGDREPGEDDSYLYDDFE